MSIFSRQKKYFKDLTCKTYKLNQNDFKEGPVTIYKKGKYILQEDIVLDFQKDNDYFPKNEQRKNFSFGFFAGIIIIGKDIILDLNGFSISMSKGFYLQQRFFSIIELASTPFIPKQGPGDFGNTFKSATNVMIKNGTIGRSSHHGIHGNGQKNIYLDNLLIKDFEVAGISLNGGEMYFFNRINIGPNIKEVPVVGTYSAARFLPLFYDRIKLKATELGEWKQLNEKLTKLKTETTKVFNQFMNDEKITVEPFINKSKLFDGVCYGILIGPIGVAVNEFKGVNFNGDYVKNVYIKDVTVSDITSNPREIPAISKIDGTGAQTDATGSVFRITELKDTYGKYNGDVLSDAQIALADFSLKYNIKIGVNSIDRNLIDWAKKDKKLTGYTIKFNCDSMFHLSKPSIGFRLDCIKNIYLYNTKVSSIINKGVMGQGNYVTSHDSQIIPCYRANRIIGYNFSSVDNAHIYNAKFSNIKSYNGDIYGLRFINNCKKIHISNIKCYKLFNGYKYYKNLNKWVGINHKGEEESYKSEMPNLIPKIFCVLSENTKQITVKNVSEKNIVSSGVINKLTIN